MRALIGPLNVLGLCVAFGLSLFAFSRGTPPATRAQTTALIPVGNNSARGVELDASGARALRDRSGNLVPLRDYQRIASASTVADALLLEFASPTRIAAFTHYHSDAPLTGHLYQGRPQLDAVHDFESLLALKPDLLIVSTLSSGVRIERLRDAGLSVFVLGEMRGLESYLQSALDVATLVGRPELGVLYADSFRRRMAAIAHGIAEDQRKTALQLVYYGRDLYGSGKETSYYDVLTAAGLKDLGAVHFTGWPALSTDQVLVLNPDVIVTRDGMGAQLCTQTSMRQLKACQNDRAAIVELPDELLNDPGPLMLPSAELIHRAVYGR